MANTNVNIFIRTICLVFSFAFFTAQSARLGELYLAINTVLLHFLSFSAYGIDGISPRHRGTGRQYLRREKPRAFPPGGATHHLLVGDYRRKSQYGFLSVR